MSKKVKFTNEEEERIIDFVKSNKILYNAKHPKFRDSEAKNRLWLKSANELEKEGIFSTIISSKLFPSFPRYRSNIYSDELIICIYDCQ